MWNIGSIRHLVAEGDLLGRHSQEVNYQHRSTLETSLDLAVSDIEHLFNITQNELA